MQIVSQKSFEFVNARFVGERRESCSFDKYRFVSEKFVKFSVIHVHMR